MSVILQPCANAFAQANFAKTIEKPVSFSTHAVALAPILQQLEDYFPSGEASVWGITPGENNKKVRIFEKADRGDAVLFYKNKRIFATGILALKFRSKELADTFWGS